MRSSTTSILLLSLASSTLALDLKLFARQAPTSSSPLAEIISVISPACNATCGVFVGDLTTCSQGISTTAIATCACSSVVLGDMRTCAACVATDPAAPSANVTLAVNSYNSYINICIADGLATATGTVEVGASTTSIARTSIAPPSSSAPNSLSDTFTLAQTTATASLVASLAAPSATGISTAVTTATGAARSSAAAVSSASAAATKASGTESTKIGVWKVVGALLSVAGAMLFLA